MKIKNIKSKYSNISEVKRVSLPAYTYYLEIYDVHITIIFGEKNLKDYNRVNGRKPCTALCVSCHLVTHGEIVLLFKDNPSINVMVHEAVHCCDRILEFIGFNSKGKANEINAYLTAHIVDLILKCKVEFDKK